MGNPDPNAVEAMGPIEGGARELMVSTEQDHAGVLVAVRDAGPGHRPDAFRSRFRGFLHHQVERNWDGAVLAALIVCGIIIARSDEPGRMKCRQSSLGPQAVPRLRVECGN